MDKKDMTFAGSGMLAGGEYGKVYFAGSGRILDEVSCDTMTAHGSLRGQADLFCRDRLDVTGSLHVDGNVSAETISVSGGGHLLKSASYETLAVSGSLRVDGDLEGGEINCAGVLTVGGSILSGSVRGAGSVRITGAIHGENVDVSGGLEVGEDCEVETFSSSGRLDIKGLLNAETVQIEVSRKGSRIEEIGGKKILIRNGGFYQSLRNNETIGEAVEGFAGAVKGLLGDLGLDAVAQRAKDSVSGGTLTVGQIEGDEISLEHVDATVVRGRCVTIGEGCHVERVEYEQTLTVLPGGEVIQECKTGVEAEKSEETSAE